MYIQCWNALICIFLQFCHSKEIFTLRFMGDEMSSFSKEKLLTENSLIWCAICFALLYYIAFRCIIYRYWRVEKQNCNMIEFVEHVCGVQFASKVRAHNTTYVEIHECRKDAKGSIICLVVRLQNFFSYFPTFL